MDERQRVARIELEVSHNTLMRAQRCDGSGRSIDNIDSGQEPSPEVIDSDEAITEGKGQSSDGEEITLNRSSAPDSYASTPPSTAPTTDASYLDHHHQQHEQTRRARRASSNARATRRSHRLLLREAVARRAFECTIGAHGELSKVVDLVKGGEYAAVEIREPMTESEDGSEFRVEPLPHGADIYVNLEVGAMLRTSYSYNTYLCVLTHGTHSLT